MQQLIELTTLLLLAVMTVLQILAVRLAIEEEMIFEFVPKYYEKAINATGLYFIFFAHYAHAASRRNFVFNLIWSRSLAFFLRVLNYALKFLKKPLYDCDFCMSSIHGAIVFIYLRDIHNLELHLIFAHLVFSLGAIVSYYQIITSNE